MMEHWALDMAGFAVLGLIGVIYYDMNRKIMATKRKLSAVVIALTFLVANQPNTPPEVTQALTEAMTNG